MRLKVTVTATLNLTEDEFPVVTKDSFFVVGYRDGRDDQAETEYVDAETVKFGHVTKVEKNT